MHEELRKRWILRQPDQAFVNRCCDELKLSALLARVIALRDLTAIEAAKCYLSSSLRSDLPSPFLMADMDAAVDRIVRAIQASESISIWGDYDVDGTTGASVLVSFLREIGVETIFYVPHRIEEGYGLNIEGLRRLKERGVRLVVMVDSGISNFKEVAAAREIGIDRVEFRRRNLISDSGGQPTPQRLCVSRQRTLRRRFSFLRGDCVAGPAP